MKLEKFFFENKNSSESIYDFFFPQQNYDKKFLTINFTFGTDYKSYISEYLLLIKASDDDKCDMLTNKILNFSFYHFNNFLGQQLLPIQQVRQTIMDEKKKGFIDLPKQN